MKKNLLPEIDGKPYYDDILDRCDVGFCDKNDYPEIAEFLDKYWRKGHIFTKSKVLFDWQHYNKRQERYNIVCAREKQSKEIYSLLGFVPTYQFDENIERVLLWPCIWKNRNEVGIRGLGIILYWYLKEHLTIECMEMLGISEQALGIYRSWGFETDKINQYFIPNRNKGTFKIISGYVNDKKSIELSCGSYSVCRTENELRESISRIGISNPYKSSEYYINRYYLHPIYKYEYACFQGENAVCLLILRLCVARQARVLRIVDVVGDIRALGDCALSIQSLLEKYDAEYIDLVNVGIDKRLLKNAGFTEVEKDGNVIVPNYFEPFIRENIFLDYAHKSIVGDKACFFKGDADQDRPNIL